MEKADLLIKNVKVFNSCLKCFMDADVSVLEGRIYYVDTKKETGFDADCTIEGGGRYLIPGLIDIHMHIESSMMTPEPFCSHLASCGVTTIVSEPHEIANVKGIEGIRHMIEAGKKAVIDVFYGIPSSVPSTDKRLETTGAEINFLQMKELLECEQVVCVGEIMNYRQIIRENNLEVTKFLQYLRKYKPQYIIEGHCPSLIDLDLAKFLYLGINGDHTEHTLEEIRQRFENGMFVEIQEKMLGSEILQYICENHLYEHFGFVTDDRMADELLEDGHLNTIVKKAMGLGLRAEDAIYGATYTNAQRMNLRDRGMIAPGKLADMILLENLQKFTINSVYKRGKEIYSSGKEIRITGKTADGANPERKNAGKEMNGTDGFQQEHRSVYQFPEDYYHSVKVKDLTLEDFVIRVPEDTGAVLVNVMVVNDGTTKTEHRKISMPVESHRLKWESSGCLLAAVFERYGKNGAVGYGFVTGDFFKRGAAATTYFHDHHNLFVAGDCPLSMLNAALKTVELQGGFVTADQSEVLSELALPVCGILSGLSVEEIGTALKKVRSSLIKMGYHHYNPIMSLCTLGLPVSPKLKLTDKGYIDVVKGSIIPLYEAGHNKL